MLFLFVRRTRNTETMEGNSWLLVSLILQHQKFMNTTQELELQD